MNAMSLDRIKLAAERISPFIYNTPILYSSILSKCFDCQIYLKMESLQKTNAFKVRGALNKIINLPPNRYSQILAASSGNHGIGVAYACNQLGYGATIVMPKGTPEIKKGLIRRYGGKVVLYGNTYDEAYEFVMSTVKGKDTVVIPSFNDEDIIVGQASLGLEIFNEISEVDNVLLPVGGGGLGAGIGYVTSQVSPSTMIVGVQSINAPSAYVSLINRERTKVNAKETIADGIVVEAPGDITFPYLQKYLSEIILVTDEEIKKAMNILFDHLRVVVEPAGATPLAAIVANPEKFKKKNVVMVVTGANVDKNKYLKILLGGEIV